MSAQPFSNIGPGERRKRLLMGVTMLAVGASLALTLILIGAPRQWRLTLFLPFWMGALGFFQAREKT